MDIFRAIVRTYANQDPSDWQVEVNVKIPQELDVSDGGIYVLIVAFRIFAGTPLLEPYDCKQWRMLLIAVIQGHPSKFRVARGLFVNFPIYNCDPEKLMTEFASDQVALVSILYAKADLNLSRLSRNLRERQEQYRTMLQEFCIQHQPSSSAYTERLQDNFKRLTQLEFESIQRQHQKGSLETLTSMAFSISQRMTEDLEEEDSRFRALLTHFPTPISSREPMEIRVEGNFNNDNRTKPGPSRTSVQVVRRAPVMHYMQGKPLSAGLEMRLPSVRHGES
ncbi:hypothetical protein KCV07_g10140, partial [Aureobasidium melanogenum]